MRGLKDMQEDGIGLETGGQIVVEYFDCHGEFVKGADDERRVKSMLESFL